MGLQRVRYDLASNWKTSQLVETAFQVFGSGKKEVTKDETACSVGGCLDTGQCWTKLRSLTRHPAVERIPQVPKWDPTNVQTANSSHAGRVSSWVKLIKKEKCGGNITCLSWLWMTVTRNNGPKGSFKLCWVTYYFPYRALVDYDCGKSTFWLSDSYEGHLLSSKYLSF